VSFYYLATPYSKYINGPERAFKEAAAQAAVLVRAGIPVFSPIAMTHPIAIEGDLDPLDHEIWLEADRTFMEAAKALIVCEMEGWAESYGVEEEIKAFRRMGKPVIYMTPGTVPLELRWRRKVVGLCGYATAGKDAAAQALVACGWERVAFADGVREALVALNPLFETNERRLWKAAEFLGQYKYEYAKTHAGLRHLLQRLGTEAGRNIHGNDCWIKLAERKIEATTKDVVITDCRFANEVEFVRSLKGRLIWIERPGVGPVNGHVSDAGLSALKEQADACIVNDGSLEELHAKLIDAAWPLTEANA
jgi:hypothetical protein